MGPGQICTDLKELLNIVGYVIIAFKIIIPILLVVYGMLDVGKAVVGAKDDEIKKSLKSFAMRAAAAVVIFFIPSIVGLLLSVIDASTNSANNAVKSWEVCRSALKL